ncbi:hypothetical protein [Prauserella cavernicola]|uniref:Uncharacterized protein n=1 Tax=Prauserella cavernicola TaxID=2800127 RepID=A0A934QZ58_9PSEU|nr:hypothetical protein [Prauserella cavernicola]MBK1789273.1 hypothetical protein [Prauserella cavernicola]
MKLIEQIGIAGTPLSWTEETAMTARRRPRASSAGQLHVESLVRVRGTRVRADDAADYNTGAMDPVFRPATTALPIQDKPWVPLCSRERCP